MILIKGYDLCTKRLPIKSRSSLRKIVERYAVNSDVKRATDKLYDVTEFIRSRTENKRWAKIQVPIGKNMQRTWIWD